MNFDFSGHSRVGVGSAGGNGDCPMSPLLTVDTQITAFGCRTLGSAGDNFVEMDLREGRTSELARDSIENPDNARP